MVDFTNPQTTPGGGTTYVGAAPATSTVLPTTTGTSIASPASLVQAPTQQVIDVYEKEVVTQPVIQEVRHHPVTEIRPQYIRKDVYEPPVTQISETTGPSVIPGTSTAIPLSSTTTSGTPLIQPQQNYLVDNNQHPPVVGDQHKKENIFSKLKRKMSAPKGPMQPGYPTNYYDPNYPYSSSTRTMYDPSTDSYGRTYPLSSLPNHNITRYDDESEYANYRASTPPLGTRSPVSYLTPPPPPVTTTTTTSTLGPSSYPGETYGPSYSGEIYRPTYYYGEGRYVPTTGSSGGGSTGGLKEMFQDLKEKVRPSRSTGSTAIPGSSYGYGYTRPPRAVPTDNYIYGRELVGGGVPIQQPYGVAPPSYGERIIDRLPPTGTTTAPYHHLPPGLTEVATVTTAPGYIRDRPYLDRGYPVSDRDWDRQRELSYQRQLPSYYDRYLPTSEYLRHHRMHSDPEVRYVNDRDRYMDRERRGAPYYSDRDRDLYDRDRYPREYDRDRSPYADSSRYYDDSRQRAIEQQRLEDQRLYDQQRRGTSMPQQYPSSHISPAAEEQQIRRHVDKEPHPFDQTKDILEHKLGSTSGSTGFGRQYDEDTSKPRKGKWHASWTSQDFDQQSSTTQISKPETPVTRSKTPDL